MSLGNKIAALLTGLTRNQVEAVSPIARQQLADQCKRIAALSEPSPPAATVKAGVLSRLKDWERSE
jgi:hypothetical protein